MTSTSTDRRQGVNAGAAVKVPCRCATTGNITLSGLQTIDGVSLAADDRVLVKNQTTTSQNGIYRASSGAWERDRDFDGEFDVVQGSFVNILSGSTLANSWWGVSTVTPLPGAAMSFTQTLLGDASTVSFLQAGAGAVSRTTLSKLRDIISVKDFGAVGDGVADDTTEVQATIDYAESVGGSTVYFPDGTYLVSATLSIESSGVHLVGAGRLSTIIQFAPTVNDVCISFAAGASQIGRCSVRDLSIMSSDSTFTKTALDVTDTNAFLLSEVQIGGTVDISGTLYWSGANSIGLRTRGREFGIIRNVWITADRPLLISQNPNDSSKALDHFDFDDLQLIANANPCAEVEDGCRLVNITFYAAQPWVRGTYGFYWVDTQATAQNSSGLAFSGIRTEGGTDSAAYSIYISLSGAGSSFLQDVSVKQSLLEGGRHGFFFRNVRRVDLENDTYAGGAGDTCLDMTGITNSVLSLNNVVMGASTTLTLTNLVRVMESRPTQTTYPIGEFAVYAFTGRDGLRHSIVATADLAAAATSNISGTIVIEDGGVGNRNLVIYAGGERFRIDGGAAF